MAKRTNVEWISDLRAGGLRQEKALADLHQVILNGLPYALSKWLPASDPRFAPFAEEVTQETLLRVIDRLDTQRGVGGAEVGVDRRGPFPIDGHAWRHSKVARPSQTPQAGGVKR